MADSPTQDKTEQPTPERLRKARREGQVPESQELYSGLTVLMLTLVLALTCGSLTEFFVGQIREGLTFRLTRPLGQEDFQRVIVAKTGQALLAMAPVAVGAAAVSVLGGVLAGGWTYAPARMRIRFDALNPMTGLKNLVSLKSLVHLLLSLIKVAVIGIVSWQYLRDQLPTLTSLTWLPPWPMLTTTGRLLLGVMARIAVSLLVIAGLDLLYQRWNYRRQLRMTRQEVKEEHRQHEVKPEIKGRIRSIQYAMARKRMLEEVPAADVVVVNPAHVAVALRYEAGTMDAPLVVAKGADFLCEKIKEVARAHGVPIVRKPPLARVIYDTVGVGQPIPEPLFVAVAEVLAMIYRLRGRRRIPAR